MSEAAPDLAALAALHAAAFPGDAWDAPMLARLLAMPGAFARACPGGFVLLRTAADEAEIVTVAVAPERRRQGLARALAAAGLAEARRRGAATAFLEVAVDNPGAIALYRSLGFAETGRRRGYYRRCDAPPADALVMARSLQDFADLSPDK